MSESSPQFGPSALGFAGTLRHRLELVPHKSVAIDAQVDASQLGKFLAGNAALRLEDIESLVKIAGLKVVDAKRVCVKAEELAFLRRVYATVVEQVPHLLQEDEG